MASYIHKILPSDYCVMIIRAGRLWASLALLLSVAALFAACGDSEDDASVAAPLEVVTTTDFMADWVGQIGGDEIKVTNLVPSRLDPHFYQPAAQDVAKIVDADLVLSVGLGLEGEWLDGLFSDSRAGINKMIVVSDAITPLWLGDASSSAGGSNRETRDPYFWMDPLRVRQAIDLIASSMAELDPTRAETYRTNADIYRERLQELHGYIEAEISAISRANRHLVTAHDHYQYFASRYEMNLAGTIVPAASENLDSYQQHLTRLLETVRAFNVSVIFAEATARERVAAIIAEETGAEMARLYSTSLGPPGTDADTYLGMMRMNAQIISQALR